MTSLPRDKENAHEPELQSSIGAAGKKWFNLKPLSALKQAWYVLTQKMETVLIRKGGDVIELHLDKLAEKSVWQLSENTAHYAVLSALVYHPITDNSSVPEGLYSRPIIDDVLSTWRFIPNDTLTLEPVVRSSGRIRISGLKYQFWYSEARNEFIVVFRGTSGKLGDWWANLRWFTRFIPGVDDHYDIVRQGMQPLAEQIRQIYGPTICISVAGHSLGGGLAQQAAYAASDVRNVYAFNSTPVTGYFEVEKSRRLANANGLRIVRIFEHGEVLAFLRFATRKMYPLSVRNPEIHEMRFNLLTRKNLISEHSMKEFARFLYERIHDRDSYPSGEQAADAKRPDRVV
ncbi:MAG: hypothetical protein AB8B63_19540 [Granulosicoccus sp.]